MWTQDNIFIFNKTLGTKILSQAKTKKKTQTKNKQSGGEMFSFNLLPQTPVD